MADNLARQLEDEEFNKGLSRQIDNLVVLPLSVENRRRVSEKIKEMIKDSTLQDTIKKNILDDSQAANDNSIEDSIDNLDFGEAANDNMLVDQPNKRLPTTNKNIPPATGETEQNNEIPETPGEQAEETPNIDKQEEPVQLPQTNNIPPTQNEKPSAYQEPETENPKEENQNDLGLDNNPNNNNTDNEDNPDNPDNPEEPANNETKDEAQNENANQEENQNGGGQNTAESPQGNMGTQAFNKVRNDKKIEKVDTSLERVGMQIQGAENKIKNLLKDKKKIENEKKPYESIQKKLKFAKKMLLVGQIFIGFFAFICLITIFLIPLALLLFGVSGSINAYKAGLQLQINLLDEKIKPINEKIKKIDELIVAVKKEIMQLRNGERLLVIQRERLINQGSPQRGPQVT